MKKPKLNIKRKRVTLKEFYSKDVDIMDFYWGGKKGVDNSRELRVSLLVDFDKKGNIVGIEIWDFLAAMKESQKKIDQIFKLADKKRKKK